MLDDPHPLRIAGDDSGRIYRRRTRVGADDSGHSVDGRRTRVGADDSGHGVDARRTRVGADDSGHGVDGRRTRVPADDGTGRVVEAYHWGRYTAGSPSRALWLLLLPFAVHNLARFALPMRGQPRRLRYPADAAFRLLGLVLTLALVQTSCYLAWEVFARQCSPEVCADAPGWARWLMAPSDGVRLLEGAALPAVVVALVWIFGRRPPSFGPPGGVRPPERDADDLGDESFWLGALTAPRQRAAHVTAACAVIGLLALAAIGDPDTWEHQVGWARTAFWWLRAACAAAGVVAVLVVLVDRQPWKQTGSRWRGPRAWRSRPLRWLLASDDLAPDRFRRDSVRIPGWHTLLRWTTVALAAACVGFAAWAADRVGPGPAAGRWTYDVATATIGASAGVLLLALLVMCRRMRRSERGRRLCGLGAYGGEVPGAFRPFYRGYAACVFAALAVTLAFGFSTAAVFLAAETLGRPARPGPAAPGEAPGISIAAGYWTSATVWGGLVVVLAVLLLPLAAWLLRRRWRVAGVLMAAAAGLVVTGLVGRAGGDVPDTPWWFVGAALAVAAAAGVVVLAGGDGFVARVEADYPAGERDVDVEATVVRSWRFAMSRYRYHHVLGVFAVLGGICAVLWAALCLAAAFGLYDRAGLEDPSVPSGGWDGATVDALSTVGVLAVTTLATALVWLGIATWRRPKIRTSVGILWDMLSFWPRVAHPLCPLPYGGRAVLAVAGRTRELLADPPETSDPPFGHVVLSGHSQGSVIALAAAACLTRRPDGTPRPEPRISLVSYGSQLQFIYARAFPTYLGFRVQQQMYLRLGGRWRNLYRWTDPLGGPVLSWPHAGGTGDAHQRFGPAVARWTTMACGNPAACNGHEASATRLEASLRGQPYVRWQNGPDIRLRDPCLVVESARAPRMPASGHGGYQLDPGFDAVVTALAAGEVEAMDVCHVGRADLPDPASPPPADDETHQEAPDDEDVEAPATNPIPVVAPVVPVVPAD
jgi:hypothetical protein